MTGPAKAPRYREGEWLREHYHGQNKSMRQIAKEAGVSPTTIRRWMEKNDIQRREMAEAVRAGKTPDERLENESYLRDSYVRERKSTNEIADELGCCSSTVNRWLKRHSISVRDRETAKVEALSTSKKLHDSQYLEEQYTEKEKTIYQIGREIGCHGDTVRRWLVRHEIATRAPGPKRLRESDRDVRTTRQYRKVRSKVIERDGNQCVDCGRGDGTESLTVHHMIPVAVDESEAMNPDNLVTLCRECHATRHKQSEYDVVDWKVVLNATPPR